MPETVEDLRKKRTSTRRRFTTSANTIQDIVSKLQPGPGDLDKVSAALIVMEDNLSEMKTLDLAIKMLLIETDEDAADKDSEDSTKLLIDNQQKVNRANTFVRNFSKPEVVADNSKTAGRMVAKSKLPKLTLPKFDGTLTDWLSFWERFLVEIDTHPDLSDINRFDYLYGLLEGKALDAVKSILPSAANYPILKDTLRENFGKNRKIVRAHVQRLFHLPKPQLSGNSLRDYYNQVMTDLRCLETLKVDVNNAAAILVPIIEEKLPSCVRADIADIDRADTFHLDTFVKAFRRQVERYEEESPQLGLRLETLRPSLINSPTLDSDIRTSTVSTLAGFTSVCEICGSQEHSAFGCKLPLKQKKTLIFSKRLCILCLKSTGHFAKQCQQGTRCNACGGLHHTAIHGIEFKPKKQNRSQKRGSGTVSQGTNVTSSQSGSTQTTSCNMGSISETPSRDLNSIVLLKTAKVTACYRQRSMQVRMFVDEGSQRSYLREDIAVQLGVEPQDYVELGVSGFHSSYSRDRYGRASIGIMTSEGRKEIPVLITSEIVAPIDQRGWEKSLSLTCVSGIELADDFRDENFVVDVLIGADCAGMFLREQRVQQSGLTVQFSNIGALLIGPLGTGCQSETAMDSTSCCVTRMESVQPVFDTCEPLTNQELDERMNLMFKSSEIGACDVTDDVDDHFKRDYSEKIQFHDGNYFVPLPWKDDCEELPSNLELCKRRLKQVTDRLLKLNLFEDYSNVMREHLSKGYTEIVPDSEDPWGEETSHFLSHFFVLKDSDTTPLRVVFAANAGNVSLNDCLHRGPCMLHNLHDLLIRFRTQEFAIVADIARAFLCIKLLEPDRNYVKFLWYRNGDPSDDIVVYRYTTVIFGNTSSPFSLGIVLEKHLDSYDTETAQNMAEKFYMDNLITGDSAETRVVRYYYDARKIMREGGFNLCQWLTNSPDLRKIVNIEGTGTKSQTTKVLGMLWDAERDIVSFPQKGSLLADCDKVTKRVALSGASSVFDPSGLVSPITVIARLFISQLWREKFDWDSELPVEKSEQWITIAQELSRIPEIEFPRWNRIDPQQKVQLHAFCDSSLNAMGTVCYLRQDNHVSLIGSKSKLVGPNSTTTVPQLELSAMVMNARYASNVAKVLSKDYPDLALYRWTDSEIGLYWIKSEKQLKRPTANKVKTIRQLTNVRDWRHVASDENPADLLSRGVSVDVLKTSELWHYGPSWLTEHDDWCPWNGDIKAEVAAAASAEVETVVTYSSANVVGKVIDIERFSDLERLLRVTVYVMRFCGLSSVRGQMTAEELTQAELLWVKSVQVEHYAEAIDYLQRKRDGKRTGKCPAIVRQLNLVLDDQGLLRGAGRLSKVQRPLLLPRKCQLTRLVILRAHQQVMHSGVGSTIVQIRMTYWIPAIRAEVRHQLQKCVICKLVTGRAYLLPPTPDLPQFRIDASKPFRNIGIDFSGHLWVKEFGSERLRKVYIALFTCLSTRCVNLEIVTDMSKDAFLQAFRRHCATYSLPDMCLADNASTFRSADEDIQELLSIVASDGVQGHLAAKRVKFLHIPVQAPWWGGAWERLIGVMKTVLKKCLGKAMITLEEMYTVVKEVQAVMNDRPMTYSSADVNELQPLTPAKLLFGHSLVTLPQPEIDEDESETYGDANSARRSERRRAILHDHFVKRFQNEYLSALREIHTYQTRKQNASCDVIDVGDVVLVFDKDLPRTQWKLGQVTQLMKGSDGHVRAAIVRTSNGRVTSRAISKLYPLEISCKVDEESQPSVSENNTDLRRSTRSCVDVTNAKIRACFN